LKRATKVVVPPIKRQRNIYFIGQMECAEWSVSDYLVCFLGWAAMKRVKQEYTQRQEGNNLHIFNIFLQAGDGIFAE